jgi:hypothetical protein
MRPSARNRPVWLCLLVWGACWLFSSGAQQAEADPEKETAAGVDRVTLSDGATIELVGVSEYPPRPDGWWSADGTPVPKPSIVDAFPFETPVANRLMRLFVFNCLTDTRADVDGPNGPTDECDRQNISVGASGATSGASLSQRNLVAAIRRAARINLAIDYEGGPWRTVASTDGHEGNLASLSCKPHVIWETMSTTGSVPEIWVAHNINLGPENVWLIAVDEDHVLHQPRYDSNSVSGHVQVRTARFPDVRIERVKEYRLVTNLADRRFRFKFDANPPGAAPADDVVWGPSGEDSDAATISAACRLRMKNGRIIAVDDQNREHLSKFGEYPSVGNFCLMTAVFPRLALARVKEFRFQARTFHHHIEFRNVSLHAGQKNPARIFLDGKRYTPKGEPRVSSRKVDSSGASAPQ